MEVTKNQKFTEAFKMKGDWKEQSKQLKIKYAQLTDEDLKFEDGKENDLLKKIEKRLSKNREEVVRIIKKGQPTTAL